MGKGDKRRPFDMSKWNAGYELAFLGKLVELKRSASRSAKFRGHNLGAWYELGKHARSAKCTKCGAEVVINEKPRPNEIEVGGEAVAINCKGK